MTYKDEIKFLKHIKSKKLLTRHEISDYLKTLTSDCSMGDIENTKKYISMVSAPVYEKYIYCEKPDDIFKLSDSGNDLLINRRHENIKFWYPHIVSTLAFIISVIALLI